MLVTFLAILGVLFFLGDKETYAAGENCRSNGGQCKSVCPEPNEFDYWGAVDCPQGGAVGVGQTCCFPKSNTPSLNPANNPTNTCIQCLQSCSFSCFANAVSTACISCTKNCQNACQNISPSQLPPNVQNWLPNTNVTGGGASPIPNPCPNQADVWTALGCVPTNPSAVVEKLLGWVIGIAGGIAFLLIIYGGFLIMTSSGDPEKLNNGKDIIVSAMAGVLMIVFSVLLLKIMGMDILQLPGFGTK